MFSNNYPVIVALTVLNISPTFSETQKVIIPTEGWVEAESSCGLSIILGSGANNSSFSLIKSQKRENTSPSKSSSCWITIQAEDSNPMIVVLQSLCNLRGKGAIHIHGLDYYDPAVFTNNTLFEGQKCYPEKKPKIPIIHASTWPSGNRVKIHLEATDESTFDSITFQFVITRFTPASQFGYCPVKLFNCGNGRCVRRSYVGDGLNNCGNNSDEAAKEQDWTTLQVAVTVIYCLGFNALLAGIVWAMCRNAKLRQAPDFKVAQKELVAQVNVAFQPE